MKKITLWLFVLFSCWQISAQSIIIGTGTATTTSSGNDPIDGYYAGFRYQVVYTAAELSASLTPNDEITGLGFSIAGDYAGGNLSGYTIKMGHTTATNSASHNTSSTTVVKSPFSYNPTVTAAGEFDMITFDTNFVWNGIDNVLVEICSDGPNPYTSPYGQVRVTSSVTNGSRYFRSDSVTACNANTDSSNSNKPNIKFTYIDGVAPSCVMPTALTSSAITEVSATISWTASTSNPANGYDYYYSTSSTPPTDTTVASGSTAAGVVTADLTGLLGSNLYYFWVKSKCGATDVSGWSNAGSFRTSCVPFYTTPFTETFDSSSNSEFCWTVLNAAGTADAWDTNYTTNPFAGNQVAMFYSDGNAGVNDDWLITPKIRLTANQRLRFQSRVQSATEPNDFEVLLSTTGNAPADFTNTLIANTSYSNITYNQLQASLAAYTGDVYIAFHIPANGLDGWRLYIDDVIVEDIPAIAPPCVAIISPVNLAENVANATITWNAQLDATSYKISVGTTAGSTDVLDQFSVGNVLSYYLAQAEAGTTYYVTVYPVNQYGTATGCTEISFTTCDESGNFSENFDTLTSGQIPTCWSKILGATYASVGASTTNNSAPNSISLYNDSATATSNTMLVSPSISNLGAGTNRLRFFAKNSTATEDIQVGTMSNPADASTFTVLQSIDINTTWAEYNVSFASYTGTNKYIAIRRLSTSTYTYVYIDGINWEAIPAVAPTCAANVVATPDTACGNFATAVTWDAVTDIDGYKISIGTSTGATDVLNEQVITTNSYSHIGNPGATYFFKVVPFNNVGSAANCTEISYSTNATGCFCTSAPTSVDGTGVTNVQLVATDFPNTVSSAPVYNDHTATAVDVQQGVNTNVQITFATAYTYDTHIWIDLNNNFTFEASEKLYTGVSLVTNPTTLNASFMMPATAALGQHRMRIATADSGQATPNPCYSSTYGETLDFTVNVTAAPSCLPPSALATTSVSPTAQNLAWTENGSSTAWDIEWGTNGFTPTGTPTVAATTTNPYSLTGLTSNTVYQFYVRAVCSSTESSAWTGPFTFTTACGTYSALSENFDALTVTGSIPNCWSRVLSGTGISTYATVGSYTWENNSTPNSIQLYNASSPATANIMLVSPVMNNLSAGTHRLRFFAKNGTATQDLEIGTMSDPADASTFTVLQALDINTTWTEYAVSFAGYTGTNTHFAFRRLSTSTYTSVYLDNVVWEAIPTTPPACVAITSPADLAENVMSGTITWAASADATSYKITVGTTATGTDVLNLFDVGNVTTYNLVTEPGTTYYVTVYPVSQYGTSTGCTTISFTTCDALNAPVLETFDTFLPGCWSNRFGGDLTTGPAATGTSYWFGDGFANNGTTGAIRNNIDYLGSNDWVISPVINIPATGYELKFDAAAVQYGQTYAPDSAWEADDMIQVLVSTNGTSWTALYTFNNTNQPSITGTTTILDLDAYASQDVRFAFRAVEGADNGDADIDFSIDNFEVRLTPAVAPGCSTITATTNANCGNFATAITWTAASGANGYKLSIGTTAGGTEVLNASDLGVVLSYNHIGLIGTTYYVTVTPYNAVGNATGCTSISYTTNSAGCYCPSAPTSVDGTGITNVQVGTIDFPNTVSTAPVYNDHTATVVDMTQGQNSNVQVTLNVTSFGSSSYDYNTVIWVDGNDNYNFEASEIVYTGVSPTTAAPTSLNASFVMPTSVPAGIHRMRIVATDESQDPANACYSGSYGETADFKVNVIVLKNDTFDDASFVYYPNPVSDVLNISYANEISKVQVINLLGQEVMVKSINATQSQIDMSNLASGSYLVKVTADSKVKTIKVIKR